MQLEECKVSGTEGGLRVNASVTRDPVNPIDTTSEQELNLVQRW